MRDIANDLKDYFPKLHLEFKYDANIRYPVLNSVVAHWFTEPETKREVIEFCEKKKRSLPKESGIELVVNPRNAAFRPKAWNKGLSAADFVVRYASHANSVQEVPPFVVFAGNDQADCKAMEHLQTRGALDLAIVVGDEVSVQQAMHIKDVSAVQTLIELIREKRPYGSV